MSAGLAYSAGLWLMPPRQRTNIMAIGHNLAIAVPGVRVRQLRLNQHTPEAVWTVHSHDHGQLLIYLTGRGRQSAEGNNYDCRPGTIIHHPPGVSHSFEREMTRPPLVLVIDLDLEMVHSTPHPCAQMPDADLNKVRTAVMRLFQIRQVRILLADERTRLQRVYIAPDAAALTALLGAPQFTEVHKDLRAYADLGAPGQRAADFFKPGEADTVYLVDPLGNWMMVYAPDSDYKKMLKDVKYLLKMSRIG